MAPRSNVSTQRRVQYALGYIGLGLINEASDELEAVDFGDRFSTEVIAARVELHMAAKHWDIVVNFAATLTERTPEDVRGWISQAFALRELDRVAEAKDVLLRALPLHGEKAALVHYNLACYECLLGNVAAAKERLATASRMDAHWKETALDDPDLKSMWDQIAAME